jgi:hypothetical protein
MCLPLTLHLSCGTGMGVKKLKDLSNKINIGFKEEHQNHNDELSKVITDESTQVDVPEFNFE